jgi:hypothetical protein
VEPSDHSQNPLKPSSFKLFVSSIWSQQSKI